jgi:hypothetical protein
MTSTVGPLLLALSLVGAGCADGAAGGRDAQDESAAEEAREWSADDGTEPDADRASADDGTVDRGTGEDAEATDGGRPDDAPATCDLTGINALVRADGSVLPLYPVSAPGMEMPAVGFSWDGTTLRAIDAEERVLWTATPGGGTLFGGFDFDADGWPDLGLAQSAPTGEICGSTPVVDSWLVFVRGATGETAGGPAPARDICWTFGTVVYPTSQWIADTVLFGASTPVLALSPYYATTSWFFTWDGAGWASESFYYPSSSSYDATYAADRANAWGTGTSFLANSHVANGLFAEVAGVPRLVFFTSGRVVHYALGPLGAAQLLLDVPFLSGGRTDIAGRNYGLVAVDPGYPDVVVLLAGTTAQTVYADQVSGTMTADPWGGIERHVTVHRLAAGTVDDRFYSYAHDGGDSWQYEGRVVFPAGPFVRTGFAGPSRLAYTVYSGGHWYLHVSQPGSTADALALRGQFLWDVRDVDRDGVDEWIVSPVELPGDPDVPGYYFPRWRTVLYHWNEAALRLDETAAHDGAIPELTATFRLPARSSSSGFLFPVLTTVAPPDCARQMVLRESSGALRFVDVP